MKNRRKLVGGYTLIELALVVLIIGILASWAIPTYTEYVRESRRADALGSLTRALNQQELFYANNQSQYTLFVASLGYAGTGLSQTRSEDGHYAIAFQNCADGSDLRSCIRLQATPTAGSSQVKDIDCAVIAINSRGRQTATTASSTANNQECWN